MTGIILITTLAIVTEAMIEYGKGIGKAIQGKDVKAVITQLVAVVVSVLLCFAADADLFQVLGIAFSHSWIGILLTGILGSRGANYVSDFVSKLQKKTE